MELYVEFVLLDNLVMDLILIKFLEFTFKQKIRIWNKVLSLILGGVMSLALPYVMGRGILVIIYKIITAVLIVMMLKKYMNFKQYLKYLIFFIMYTFVLGGAILGFIGIFNIEYTFNGVIIYDFEFPISLFVILFSATIWLLKKMAIALKEQMRSANYLCEVTLIDRETSVQATGFMDSGNKVERNGEGVSIISLDLFMKLHKEISVKKICYQTIDEGELTDIKYINIGGLDMSKKYLSFKIDNMIINNKNFKSQTVAVSMKNFETFDCILSSKFIGVENE